MSLVRFLIKLKHKMVTLEMKNETQVHGTIFGIDSTTITFILTNAEMTIKKHQDLIKLNVLIIRGNYICYCTLPETLPLDKLILDEGSKE